MDEKTRCRRTLGQLRISWLGVRVSPGALYLQEKISCRLPYTGIRPAEIGRSLFLRAIAGEFRFGGSSLYPAFSQSYRNRYHMFPVKDQWTDVAKY